MKKSDIELFEKMRVAGKLAARTLDELTPFIKAKKQGVKILSYNCKLSPQEIKVNQPVKIL